jgi:hypothetical protein
MELAKNCNLSLTNIVEKGQQIRVLNYLFDSFNRSNTGVPKVYINHLQFERQFVVTKRPRAASSFPEKPWCSNVALGSSTVRHKDPPAAKSSRKRTMSELFHGAVRKAARTTPAPSTKRFTGGFVLDPEAGLYEQPEHAVVTLDFGLFHLFYSSRLP